MCKLDFEAVSWVFETEDQVVDALIFGLAQNGVIPAGSDLNIGVLFAARPSLDMLAWLRAELQAVTNFTTRLIWSSVLFLKRPSEKTTPLLMNLI